MHRAVVPTTLIPKVIRIAHITHTGHNKTIQNVRKRFTWKNMIADVINFVNSCETCKKLKNQNPPKTPFLPAPVPTEPAQKISMDLLGPLKNHSFILTVIDHFSRHLELYNLHQITANAVTKAFLSYISTHGKPNIALTDKGSQFTSDLFHAICKKIKIHIKHTTVCNPQANGLSERINTQIKTAINTMLSEGYDAYTAMKIHQSIYNSTTHPATQYTPNFVHFARELNDIYSHYKNQSDWKILDTTHDIFELTKILDEVYTTTYLNNETTRQEVYKRSREDRSFQKLKVNDKVLVKFPKVFKKENQGPFIIQKIISPAIVQIKSIENEHASPLYIHTNKLIHLDERKEHLIPSSNNDPSTSIQNPDSIPDNDPSTSTQKPDSIPDNTDSPQTPIQKTRIIRPTRNKKIKDPNFFYY